MADTINGSNIGDAGNDRSTANNFNGSGTTTITGSVGGADANDNYKFTAISRGTASFSLSDLSADIDFKLVDSSGNVLRTSNNTGTASESFTYSVAAGKTYSLWVDPYSTAVSNYTLTAILPSGGGTPAVTRSDTINGSNIGDAGNDRSTANNFGGSGTTTITGSVGGADANDNYKFTAISSGTASFSLSDLSADIDFKLVDSSGNVLRTSNNTGTASESFTYSVVAGKTYSLWVDPYSTAVSNYTLTAILPSGGGTPAVTRSDTINGSNIGDAGNDRSTANNFGGSGTTTITGSVGGADANDNYKFTAISSGTASFSLSDLSADIDFKLVDSSGNVLRTSNNTGTASESFTYSVVAGKTYSLWVDPYSTAVSNYTLTAILPSGGGTPAVTRSDTINGSNIGDAGNDRSTANNFGGSGTTTITGSVGGADANDNYKFTAISSGTASFSLSDLSADIDFKLVDSSGNVLRTSNNTGTASESFTYSVVAGKTYSLWVDPYSTAVSNYTLTAILPSGGGATPIVSFDALKDGFIRDASDGYRGFPYNNGNCTAYVAWRLDQEAGSPTVIELLGVTSGRDAKNWDNLASNQGYDVIGSGSQNLTRLNSHFSEGQGKAIAVWDDGSFGHVAFVENAAKTPGGHQQITVTESHYGGNPAPFYAEVFIMGVSGGSGPGKMGSMPDHYILL